VLPGPDREARDLRTFRELLDDPALRKVFLVSDQIGDPGEQQVTSIVEQTSHHDYFKVTVSQGIVIDPRHPGKAVVFAVVLDRHELESFRNRLKGEFKDRVQEDPVDPAITLQLADIGQVVALPAHPSGDVTYPPSTRLAMLAHGQNVTEPSEHSLASLSAERDQPTLEQERSRPDSDLVRPGQANPTENLASRSPNKAVARPGVLRSSRATEGEAEALAQARSLQADEAGAARASPPARALSAHFPVGDGGLIVLVWLAESSPG
jgi:hypothetical protein